MKQAFIPKPDALLEIAFSRARKQASGIKLKDRLQAGKEREIVKIEIITRVLDAKLEKTVQEFPSVDKMPEFAKELLEATVELDKTRQALGQFSAARRIIKKIRARKVYRIKGLGSRDKNKILKESREFFGRISSIVKSLEKSIDIFNETARRMNELPSINFEVLTIILAGFPNTGKSTILGRITKSKPKIASYPFTTQKLQIGYFEERYQKIQVIDTPGLLDRSIEKRNKIEKKAVAAIRHLAKVIVFVIDPLKGSGIGLQTQLNLLEEIKKIMPEAKIIIAINKADLATDAEIEEAKKAVGKEALLEGEGIESRLKEKIVEKLWQKKEEWPKNSGSAG